MSNLRFVYLLILILTISTSCSKKSNWQCSRIISGYKDHSITRLVYPNTDLIHDIQLEIIASDQTLKAYLNLYSIKAPSIDGDDKTTLISLLSPNGTWQLYCDRLSGGQKLKFTKKSLDTLINLLNTEPYLVLAISDTYRLKLTTDDFQSSFNKLNQRPISILPNKAFDVAF